MNQAGHKTTMIFLPALVSQMLGCQVGTATSGLEMTFFFLNRRDKFKMGLSKWIPMQSDKGSNKKEGLGYILSLLQC